MSNYWELQGYHATIEKYKKNSNYGDIQGHAWELQQHEQFKTIIRTWTTIWKYKDMSNYWVLQGHEQLLRKYKGHV